MMAAEGPIGGDDLGVARKVRHELVEIARAFIGPIGEDSRGCFGEGAAGVLAGQLGQFEVRWAIRAQWEGPPVEGRHGASSKERRLQINPCSSLIRLTPSTSLIVRPRRSTAA